MSRSPQMDYNKLLKDDWSFMGKVKPATLCKIGWLRPTNDYALLTQTPPAKVSSLVNPVQNINALEACCFPKSYPQSTG